MTIKLSSREEAKVIRDRLAAERRKAAKLTRPKSKKADRGRVRDNGYLAFLRRQPCCVAWPSPDAWNRTCDGHTQAAHIRFGDAARGKPVTGMQVKPDDRWATPLCEFHHGLQHSMNERKFWECYDIDAIALAERLYAEYRGLR